MDQTNIIKGVGLGGNPYMKVISHSAYIMFDIHKGKEMSSAPLRDIL